MPARCAWRCSRPRRSRSTPSARAAASRDAATPTRRGRRFGHRGCATSRSRIPRRRVGRRDEAGRAEDEPVLGELAGDDADGSGRESWSCRPVSWAPTSRSTRRRARVAVDPRCRPAGARRGARESPQRSGRAASSSASASRPAGLRAPEAGSRPPNQRARAGVRRGVHLRLPDLCETINSIVADRSTRRKRATLRDLAAATGSLPGRGVVCAPRPARLDGDRGPRACRGGAHRIPVGPDRACPPRRLDRARRHDRRQPGGLLAPGVRLGAAALPAAPRPPHAARRRRRRRGAEIELAESLSDQRVDGLVALPVDPGSPRWLPIVRSFRPSPSACRSRAGRRRPLRLGRRDPARHRPSARGRASPDPGARHRRRTGRRDRPGVRTVRCGFSIGRRPECGPPRARPARTRRRRCSRSRTRWRTAHTWRAPTSGSTFPGTSPSPASTTIRCRRWSLRRSRA